MLKHKDKKEIGFIENIKEKRHACVDPLPVVQPTQSAMTISVSWVGFD